MDRHVEEQAATTADVLQRRRGGIATDDVREQGPAHRAGCHRIAHRLVAGIESTVEPDHERDAAGFHCGSGEVDVGDGGGHRLLAQDRLTGACASFDDVQVCSGCSADRHSIYAVDQVIHTRRAHGAQLCRNILGDGSGHVVDRGELCLGELVGHDAGVHAADATHAHDSDSYCVHDSSPEGEDGCD